MAKRRKRVYPKPSLHRMEAVEREMDEIQQLLSPITDVDGWTKEEIEALEDLNSAARRLSREIEGSLPD